MNRKMFTRAAAIVLVLVMSVLSAACEKNTQREIGADPTPAAGVTITNTTAPTAAPTETPTPTDEPTPTNTPTPTPDPHKGMVRSALTNEWIPEEIGKQRPIAVMMNNILQGTPQTSINQAGVVYECKVEGNITRLLAVIEDWEGLAKIGSVRSVRKYYVFWALEWDAIILHYGGPVIYVNETLARKDVNNLDGQFLEGKVFYRTKDRVAPHNAYGSGEGVVAGISIKGYSRLHTDRYAGPNHFRFADDGTENKLLTGTDAKIVRPGYEEEKPWFEYNPEDGLYYRYQYGKAQIDDMTGEQITCKNIIIQYAKSETLDQNGYKAFTTNDKGRGGYYITNGKAVPIKWSKSGDYEPTKFHYENGEEIVLNTGKTWICVVREQDKGTVKIEP
ncbi:MAG: DUF3048 domain-containing protein [Lachnospiraceae bacterium]|nr:DUF3048 domain-containing protein [Lachnospiraceae bacterium]